MPREYQKKKNNPYLLPNFLYKSVKYAIMDYDRLLEEYENIIHSSPPPPDGMPGCSQVGNPTEDKAIKCESMFKHLECIDQALHRVPIEYRRGVFNEARYGGGFPIDAGRATYQRWKQRFVYWVAENMNLV